MHLNKTLNGLKGKSDSSVRIVGSNGSPLNHSSMRAANGRKQVFVDLTELHFAQTEVTKSQARFKVLACG
jgi:hypothetical protein